jgi:azurin
MKMRRFKIAVFSLAIGGTIGLSACGGDKTAEDTAPAATTSPQTTAPETVGKTIDVILNATDQMHYDKSEIRVKEGQTVVLTLNHIGTLPIASMGHNFVLLKQGTDIAAFATKAMDFADNNYIPSDSENVIAHTIVIGGGGSTSVTFKAPEKGTYDYICSFPGHYSMMKGKFIVE